METAEKPFLAIERTYPVAPEKVWRAWTDPEALKRWWGPAPGTKVARVELDVRVGGRYRIQFGGGQGTENEIAGVYKEVEKPRKLVFSWCWPNSTPERVSLVTLLFIPSAGGTELRLRHEQFFDEAAAVNHKRGWAGLFDNFDHYLQSL
jgi:uncharacterized protein YndB with AHSA1/START domain